MHVLFYLLLALMCHILSASADCPEKWRYSDSKCKGVCRSVKGKGSSCYQDQDGCYVCDCKYGEAAAKKDKFGFEECRDDWINGVSGRACLYNFISGCWAPCYKSKRLCEDDDCKECRRAHSHGFGPNRSCYFCKEKAGVSWWVYFLFVLAGVFVIAVVAGVICCCCCC